VHVYTSV